VSETPCVIIAGCGRSGTTLLRVMLDTHSSICCGPESDLFRPCPPPAKRLAARFGLEEEEVHRLIDSSRSQAEFIEMFFDAYRTLRGKRRWAEKSPRNILYLDFIFAHFHNAYIIHLIRDGRDVVCSLRTHPKSKLVGNEVVQLNTWNPIERCIERWVHDVQAGLEFRGHPRYMEVFYEDLVNDTPGTMRKVLEFIEEPFENSILEYYSVNDPSRDSRYFSQSSSATAPIHTQSLARWKRELSEQEYELFKKKAGGLMIHLGYDLTEDIAFVGNQEAHSV
jgi:protein-tyrosine sulfotransferase